MQGPMPSGITPREALRQLALLRQTGRPDGAPPKPLSSFRVADQDVSPTVPVLDVDLPPGQSTDIVSSPTVRRESDSGVVAPHPPTQSPAERAPRPVAHPVPHPPAGDGNPAPRPTFVDGPASAAPAPRGSVFGSDMVVLINNEPVPASQASAASLQNGSGSPTDSNSGNKRSSLLAPGEEGPPRLYRVQSHRLQQDDDDASQMSHLDVDSETAIKKTRSPDWTQSPQGQYLPSLSTRRRSVSGLFLLLRAYMLIKTRVRRWRKKRMERVPEQYAKKSLASYDEVQHILTAPDSNEWLHVFVLDDLVIKDEHKGVTNVHISTTHLYFNSRVSKFITTMRLSDIVRILPTGTGLELLVTPPSTTGQIRIGGVDPESQEQLESVLLETQELSYIALHIFDVQSRVLRQYSAQMATSLRTLQVKSQRTLHVVHFNDVYHLPPFKPATARGVVGGASRFHSVLASIRERYNPLVLFSGDFMGPSLMSVITKGKQMIDAFNFLGVHYGCFGNHEFDFGLRTLKEVVHGYTQGKHIYPGSQTTWIMSNMTEADGSPLGGAQEYATCKWNGIKVGLIGLCENWIPQCAYLKPNEAYYHDMYEIGEQLAQRLKQEQGAEIVLALTHNRLNLDKEVMQRCPSIDYLLGGHDHFYKSDPKSRILKSGQEFEYLSFVEFELGEPGRGINKVRIDTRPIMYETPQSDYMKGLIERYNNKMTEKLGKPIGMSTIPLDSTEECIRFREGHLTNFILDIMQDEAGADFAVLGAAAIAGKEVKQPGPVTIGDVFGWFPNETRIMTMSLNGSTIRKMLDVMVRELPAEAPSFPHPSRNLTFTINTILKPPRCRDIFIKGEALDDEKHYKVAVEEFVGNGKAKYKFVPVEGHIIVGDEMAPQLVHWVLDYFVKRKGTEASADKQEREEALKTISKVVSSATRLEIDSDMEKSQKFIRSLICQLLHCDRSSVFLVDEKQNELHFIPDNSSQSIRFPRHVGLAGHVATTNLPINIPDVYDDPRFNRDVDKRTGYRTRSMLACPVCLDGEKCVAVVQAINKEHEGVFVDVDELMLRLLGEQVGFQLRNAEIYADAKSKARMEMGCAEDNHSIADEVLLGDNVVTVFKAFASDVCLDQSGLLRSVIEYATKLINADKIYVVFQDAATREFVTVTEDVEDDETTTKVVLEEGTRLEQVLSKGEKFVENHARDVSVVTHQRDMNDMQIRNALLVPMTTAMEEVVGAVCWFNKRERSAEPMYSDQDAFAAYFFGQLCAVAYQNTTRIEGLNILRQENNLQTVPDINLGRITIRGGWRTVRENVKVLAQWAKDEAADEGDEENFLFVPDNRLPSLAAGAEMGKVLQPPSGEGRQPSLPGVSAAIEMLAARRSLGMSIDAARRQSSIDVGVSSLISKMIFEVSQRRKTRKMSAAAALTSAAPSEPVDGPKSHLETGTLPPSPKSATPLSPTSQS